jgi:hypothetical protein
VRHNVLPSNAVGDPRLPALTFNGSTEVLDKHQPVYNPGFAAGQSTSVKTQRGREAATPGFLGVS